MTGAVSVVIPCYRCAETVGRALQSVLAQTVPPLEIIAVDDASPDRTLELLRGFEREHGAQRIKVVALPRNRGPAAARNAGWQDASGEYVAFLDADDAWHPRKLEIQEAFMKAHPEFAISGHRHVMAGRFGPLPESAPHVEIGAGQLLLANRFVTPSAMVRRDLPLRFPDEQRYMEDHLFWLQAAFAGYRIARIEAPLAALFKPQYGAAGQSAALWPMERAELANYGRLRREGRIGAPALAVLAAYSLLKFLRRLAIVGLRRLTGA